MSPAQNDDERWMREALVEAAKARHQTSPNPMVGAIVLDRAGREVARAHHERAGQPHAERLALERAQAQARGGTLYLTLEPCVHRGRTPPCIDVVIASGVETVVVAMEDPDPRVRGGGIRRLREAGIKVRTNPAAQAAERLNRFYRKQRTTGRPFVTAKWAMTLDGKIATAKGESRWISSEESRREAHALRHEHDAVLVGVGTILADDPELTARGEDWYRQPLRIVVDSRLRTPPDARVAAPNTLVATLAGDPQVRRQLESKGVEVLEIAPTSDGRVDIQDLLRLLGERPLLSVLVEGGPQVHGALFDARVVDAAAIFIAPLLVGGENAPSAVGGHGITALGDAYRLEEVTLRKLGPDIMITGDVQWDR